MKIELKKFFNNLKQKISDDDIMGNAAQVAFYFTFALFPLLLFLMTLLGLILSSKESLQTELFQYLQQVMPSSAYTLVKTTLDEVTKESSGGTLTIGILITLWAAAAGIDNLRGALNEVYNLKETRAFWKTKLLALFLTLAIGILIIVALSMIFYSSQVLSYALPIESPIILKVLGWITVFAVMTLTFALIYNFIPNHSPFEWKWISPGAISAIILWILFSLGFQLYLHFFDSYAKTYGSLGAVIILLLWLYLTALVILIGGAVNAILDSDSGYQKEAEDPKQVLEEKTQNGKESKTK